MKTNMKYQPISLSPNDAQLLETRRFSVEEICRWFGVPPVLVGHSNVTTWGSGIEQILDGFYKLTVRPMLTVTTQTAEGQMITARLMCRTASSCRATTGAAWNAAWDATRKSQADKLRDICLYVEVRLTRNGAMVRAKPLRAAKG